MLLTVFNYSVFNPMVLTILKLMQISFSDTIVSSFMRFSSLCQIRFKVLPNLFQINFKFVSNEFQICFKFVSNVLQINFKFTSNFSSLLQNLLSFGPFFFFLNVLQFSVENFSHITICFMLASEAHQFC